MTYFADFTLYSYRLLPDEAKRVCIGWLDDAHPFESGEFQPEVIGRIEELCKSPSRRTRGWHHCPFCQEYPVIHRLKDGGEITLGDAEIDIQSHGVIYSCPTLILHYMSAHRYKPPDEFLNAVISGGEENAY